MTRSEYYSINSNFQNALLVLLEACPNKTDYRFGSLIRGLANAARLGNRYDEAVKYDRMDLDLARQNPDVFDDWLFASLSSLGNDLFKQGGKENLAEAETSLREALTLALKVLPEALEKSATRAQIAGMYSQLAQVLVALQEWEKAYTEIVNLLAFNDKTQADYDEPIQLNEGYNTLLQIAQKYLDQDKYDDSVRITKVATTVLMRMIDQAPSFAPQSLSFIIKTMTGHQPVFVLDDPPSGPDEPQV
jgi:tetratricopeptide (TPR) repeat protein